MVEQPEKRDRSKRSETQSTMAVSREIADKVREQATANGVTAFELVNTLLDYALEHAGVTAQKVEVKIVPAGQAKGGRRSAKK